MKKHSLRLILTIGLVACIVASYCLLSIGCDQSNSDAYGWDDATATPDSGDAMNSGSEAPPRPTPYRPAPTPKPTPTPESESDSDSDSKVEPTPSPHVHNWEPYFKETQRKVRRTVEEVFYTCSVCDHETDNQKDADSHANTLHTGLTAHVISAGTVWGSVTTTYYRCDGVPDGGGCGKTFDSVQQWQAHASEKHPTVYHDRFDPDFNSVSPSYSCSCGDFWGEEADFQAHITASPEDAHSLIEPYTGSFKCLICGEVFANFEAAEGHTSVTSSAAGYSIITASEPIPETVYRCSCGNVFYSRSQAERHAANAGPGNPPYAYTTERRTVEKEVTIIDKEATDQMVCTICGEKRDA